MRSVTFLVVAKNANASRDLADYFQTDRQLDAFFEVESVVTVREALLAQAPGHVPAPVQKVFDEGAECAAIGAFNAAGTMFRLCVDLVTKDLLPADDVAGLTPQKRRSLGLRLQWLFDQGRLAAGLKELSHCIKEDGNDGAHAGTLSKEDVEDLLEFTVILLERLFTEPAQLRIAKERRDARRVGGTPGGTAAE